MILPPLVFPAWAFVQQTGPRDEYSTLRVCVSEYAMKLHYKRKQPNLKLKTRFGFPHPPSHPLTRKDPRRARNNIVKPIGLTIFLIFVTIYFWWRFRKILLKTCLHLQRLCINAGNSDTHYWLALATLGGTTEIGSFLFMTCRPRWPRQVSSDCP